MSNGWVPYQFTTSRDTGQVLNPNFTYVLLPDDAMVPIFKKGDYVGGIAFYGPELPQLENGPYIIEISDGIRGARNLHFNKESNQYKCTSVNPDYPSYTVAPNRLISVAKISWHMLMV
jgi:hypothetical protein